MEVKTAVAARSSIIPPTETHVLVPQMFENSVSDDSQPPQQQQKQQQKQQPNKRKAQEADLEAAVSFASLSVPASRPTAATVTVTAPSSATAPPLVADTCGLATPPLPPAPSPVAAAAVPTPPTIVTRQGSCAEMAIALDSSSDEEDVTDVPVDGVMAAGVAAAAVTPAAATVAAAAAVTLPPARTTAKGGAKQHSFSIRLPANARMNATPARCLNGGASAGGGAGGASGLVSRYAAQAAAASQMYDGGGGGGGRAPGRSSSPPRSKRSKVAKGGNGTRQRGRPMGSRTRSGDEDPPYVAQNPPKRAAGAAGSSSDDGPIATSRPRRRCEPRMRWADQMMNPGEQWARKVPKSERPLPTNPVEASIPDAPTFYPTEEQFRDPLAYIESIRPKAESYGIAKIVPPHGWNPPQTPLSAHATKLVPTKKQALHSLMNSDEVYDDGDDYTIINYKMMADRVAAEWANRNPPTPKPRAAPRYEPMGPFVEVRPGASQAEREAKIEENAKLKLLEREYWNVVDGGVEELEVEYANDLNISDFWSGFPMPQEDFMDGKAFDRTRPCDFADPEYYRTCGWNLNNLPFWPGSVLRFFRTHINGLTAPWLYLGMQYATFAWHNEDNYLYSLNYHHSGAPKQWYGVPGKHAKGFERCLAKILGETLETVSEHLYRITKMLSPVYLQEANVPVCRLQQHPGQFVVTFPKAYHGGFSYGFNCGEAVNFAVPDWITYSRESTEAYRSASRMAALSHDKMVATLTMYLPDHDVKGCELVVRELRRIHKEELEHRASLQQRGVQDPARQGVRLPRFRLGLIEKDTEEYDERRVCKTCKHTLFMTGVACPCSDVDVSCLRCVEESCDCDVGQKYLLSWWTEEDLTGFVRTAETYLRQLADGQANEAAIASFRANINPF